MKAAPDEIRRFLLTEVKAGTPGVAANAASKFGLSRQAASAHLARLEREGLVRAEGKGRGRHYSLARLVEQRFVLPREGLEEDVVWREHVAPIVADLPGNVRDVWHYGVTEMINNAIDHSEGMKVSMTVVRTALDTEISVMDDGEGIFRRIQRLLGLYDPREAILELAKGKLTTDPQRHTGEGIFFTSRLFDHFSIRSGTLHFSHRAESEDWLSDEDLEVPGTRIQLALRNDSPRTTKEVMDRFADPDNLAFNKTVVPVRLARHEGEKLVSRSQAKRLVARFERFKTVILDFRGVEEIGQAFADEVFRVFAAAHPDVTLIAIHAGETVSAMIRRARASAGLVDVIRSVGVKDALEKKET